MFSKKIQQHAAGTPYAPNSIVSLPNGAPGLGQMVSTTAVPGTYPQMIISGTGGVTLAEQYNPAATEQRDFILWLSGAVDLLDATPPSQAQWDKLRERTAEQVARIVQKQLKGEDSYADALAKQTANVAANRIYAQDLRQQAQAQTFGTAALKNLGVAAR